MEDRRNTYRLTDLSQTGTAVNSGRFRCQKPSLSACNGVTSCGKYDNIVLDQLLYNGDVPRIQRGSCVVSPNHAADTPYAAVDDVIVQGGV